MAGRSELYFNNAGITIIPTTLYCMYYTYIPSWRGKIAQNNDDAMGFFPNSHPLQARRKHGAATLHWTQDELIDDDLPSKR